VRLLSLAAAALLAPSGCAAPRRRAAPASVPVPAKAKAILRTAKSYLPEEEAGRPTPKDCSDFVDKVFAENGIELPRASMAMSILGTRVNSARELRMGDLVFFSGEKANRIVGHVGIYYGNGIFIHLADHDVGVRMESLYSDYYRKRYLTVRRVIP
jgi:cell wall-associated NlpC family hydrolase